MTSPCPAPRTRSATAARVAAGRQQLQRRDRWSARLVVALIVAALTAGACTRGEPRARQAAGGPAAALPSTAATGGTFYAFSRQPSSVDPGRAKDDELAVVGQLFDSLTAADAQLRVVPAAAERWENNRDATVFTFFLRRDATFHDGTPVTADAFKRGWQRILNDTTPQRSPAFYLLSPVEGFEQSRQGGDLTGVRAVDAHILQVRLNLPIADFPAVASHPALAPVPAAAVDTPERFAQMPVGNGPFRLAEPLRPGRFIRLQAFERYPGNRASLDEIVYRIYDGDGGVEEGYEDFVDGKLDVAPIPEGGLQAAIEEFGASSDGYRGPGVLTGTQLITAFYGFNTERPPFDDRRVRQALSLLIDRTAIVQAVTEGDRAVATSLVPPAIAGYEPAACRFCRYDPDKARQLLGARKVGQIELTFYDSADHRHVAERVQRDVNAALGPGTLTLKPLPRVQWYQALRHQQPGFFLSGWLAEYPAADNFLYPLLHQSRIGSDNLTRYKNRQVDALLDRARRTLDPEQRAALFRQAEASMLTDMPVVPLFYYRHARVVAERVHGFVLSPMGDVDMTQVRLASTQ